MPRTPKPRRPLLVADTPWLLYRAFFSLPKSIVDGDGRPVGALLGTVNALVGAIAWCDPRAVVACFGAEEAPYRVALYAGYHAHRDPMPDVLRSQWERAPALLESFGWTIAGTDELEADDLLLSYARAEARAGGRTLVLTADRDLYQAVDESTALIELGRDGPVGEIGPAEVRRRVGVDPAQVPDLIALRGDPSDGLPGAPGVGAKTAAALLASYGSLEGAIAGALRERPRVAGALRDNAEQLRAFLEIATIVELDLKPPPDGETDYAGGAAAAREHRMKQLAERLERLAAGEPAAGRRRRTAEPPTA